MVNFLLWVAAPQGFGWVGEPRRSRKEHPSWGYWHLICVSKELVAALLRSFFICVGRAWKIQHRVRKWILKVSPAASSVVSFTGNLHVQAGGCWRAWCGGTAGHCHRVTSLCFSYQDTWEPSSSWWQEGGGDGSALVGSAVLLLLLTSQGGLSTESCPTLLLQLLWNTFKISGECCLKIAGEWLGKLFLNY